MGMKKILLGVIIALATTGIGFAHGHHGNRHGRSAQSSINGGHYHNGIYYNGYH
jgi:hypothetical protein